MVVFPNCKINIGLYITGKRADGYHNLETVFYPVPWTDVLELVPSGDSQSTLTMTGREVAGKVEQNLVWQAYERLHTLFPDLVPPLSIFLHKVLPMGAGLGGGSADGAFMLRAVNDFCNLGLSETQLVDMALSLGSDCPFFIRNTPQYATGRGEVMEPIQLDLSNYSIQLVCPELAIATKDAFSRITPRTAPLDLRRLTDMPVIDWKDQVYNDFETSVFHQYPVLADIKSQLYEGGALYASLSGSGSTVYGIFPKGHRTSIAIDVQVEHHYIA